MTLTLNLSPEQERGLQQKAIQAGKSPETLVVEVVDSWLKAPNDPAQETETWGARTLAKMYERGLKGIWQDLPESSEELARKFQMKAQGGAAEIGSV